MKTPTYPNNPASPVLTQSAMLQNETSLGLTKREDFAKAAMIGLLSSIDWNVFDSKELVKSSVRIADELIEALNKEEQ